MSKFYFSFPSNETALKTSEDIFGILISSLRVSGFEKHRLKAVVSELFVNAYLNGNNADPSKYIDVILDIEQDSFEVVVKDQGNGIGRDKFKTLAQVLSNSLSDIGRLNKVDYFKDSDGRFCMRAQKRFDRKFDPVLA